MNPYNSTLDTTDYESCDLTASGGVLVSLGYFCLIPAILFALLIVAGTVMYGLEDGFAIPFRMRWPLAMVGSLFVFVVSSAMMTRQHLRFLMYISGAATVFCAAIYDTYNVVELNAYTGQCGNPVMAGLMFRFACFSTFAGIPIIALAGLVGITTVDRKRTGEPCDATEPGLQDFSNGQSTFPAR